MPMGSFLDSLPTMMFVAAHVVFLAVGIWAVTQAKKNKARFASAFWLYAVSQIVFLSFFGGLITMKMAVLVEQTLIVIMVIWIALNRTDAA